MHNEISQRDLRNRSAEIMDAVGQGTSFVVTRGGAPIGELIPLRRRRTVTREQFAAASVNAPIVDPDLLRRDLDDLFGTMIDDPYVRS